jgi:hypothetical protein
MRAATLAEAREAKQKLFRQIASRRDVNGVGIARDGRGYAIKVNLSEEPHGRELPTEVDGVPVRVELVGAITKRSLTAKGAAKRRSA